MNVDVPRLIPLGIPALLQKLGSSEHGLSTMEATRRLREVGRQTSRPRRVARGPVLQLVRLFINPLALILLIASAVSASLGDDRGRLNHRRDRAAGGGRQLRPDLSVSACRGATA